MSRWGELPDACAGERGQIESRQLHRTIQIESASNVLLIFSSHFEPLVVRHIITRAFGSQGFVYCSLDYITRKGKAQRPGGPSADWMRQAGGCALARILPPVVHKDPTHRPHHKQMSNDPKME
jgi:hypothetical protein